MSADTAQRFRQFAVAAAAFAVMFAGGMGVWGYARQQATSHTNPFEGASLATGMTRQELLDALGPPEAIKQTPDGSYERLTYRRNGYSLELFLLRAKLERWNESGPAHIRGQGPGPSGCCL